MSFFKEETQFKALYLNYLKYLETDIDCRSDIEEPLVKILLDVTDDYQSALDSINFWFEKKYYSKYIVHEKFKELLSDHNPTLYLFVGVLIEYATSLGYCYTPPRQWDELFEIEEKLPSYLKPTLKAHRVFLEGYYYDLYHDYDQYKSYLLKHIDPRNGNLII